MSRISNVIVDAKSNGDLSDNFSNIIQYLENNHKIRYTIWLEMDEYYKRQDLLEEIDEYNASNDTNHEFTDEELNLMLEEFTDRLDNDDSYFLHRFNVVEKWCRDKEIDNGEQLQTENI